MDDCVLFTEYKTACGQRFGHATLNAPKSLNALSLAMVDRLAPQLDAWAADPEIVGVILDGSGEKAFCAGGDVAALHHAIRATTPDQADRRYGIAPEVEAFFEREYRLDYRIHTYPKPILCWGNGIVMGGGIGLLAGSSHRVATPSTRLAMPEINIGLYPDVGGSWFLRRMPGHTGLFLALTAASINAADARFAGLADFVLAHEDQGRVIEALCQTRWATPDSAAGRDANHARLGSLLDSFAITEGLAPSMLRTHFDRIEALMGHDGLLDIAQRLSALAADSEPWLAQAGKTFVRGAPSSAWLSWALWQRTKHLSLAEIFRVEYIASVVCTTHADFVEGVRALLIDKDRNPSWQHKQLSEVSSEHVDSHFKAHFSGAHPLADLV